MIRKSKPQTLKSKVSKHGWTGKRHKGMSRERSRMRFEIKLHLLKLASEAVSVLKNENNAGNASY